MSSILWLTWKDHEHPDAGGAEVVLRELSRRLVRDHHEVTWLTAGYKKGTDAATKFDEYQGIHIIRIGTNRYVHSFQALAHYARSMRNKFDVVIEVVNTAPYFSVFFGRRSKRFLFYHQLAREIWHHETKPPISFTGYYVFEPAATRLLASSKTPVITVSESTRNDLAKFGFDRKRVHIISQGIEIDPVESLDLVEKFKLPTVLSLGAMRSMKRTLDQIKAYELAKVDIPTLRLKIAGSSDGEYGEQVLHEIKRSLSAPHIRYYGKVPLEEKIRLLRRSHITVQTSLKEGWGLTISEAAAQGTPAVAYDVDGLRDSIRHEETGLLTEANPKALADGIRRMFSDEELYERCRRAAWEWSKRLTFDRSYEDFKKVLELA